MIHLPRHPREWSFFGLFLIGGIWTMIYECCIVMWHYHQEWNKAVIFHITFIVLLACIIYSDVYLLMSTDVSVKQVSRTDDTLQLGWKYCEKCQNHVPPRSHHCKICDICILKRDHHCWFVGYCVGFHNHRYFVSLALYTCIAGIYCNIYNWEFVLNQKGGFAWTTIPAFFSPHAGLFFGQYTLYEFALTANTSVGVFFTCFFIMLVYAQVMQISKGQVMYERKKGISIYNRGLRNSINDVFGSGGLLMLFWPYLPTKFSGDGTHFSEPSQKSE